MPAVIDPRVDFYLQGDWRDKTSHVRQVGSPITISGGTKDASAGLSPSTCALVMDNGPAAGAGAYDPRNPMGQYFGEIGKNTPIRVRVPLLTDNVSQTVSNGWGVNWDNGASSGGTIANTDWTRTGTKNRQAVPAVGVRRSLLKIANQYMDSCTRTRITIGTADVLTGAIASTLEFRYVDTNNYVAVSFVFRTNETIGIYVADHVAGTVRTLLEDTTIAGLSLATTQTYDVAALVEGQVVRAKIWASNSTEPADWQVATTRATVRYGQSGLKSEIATGNTNTKPLNFDYDNVVIEARPFVGEASKYVPNFADESHAAPYVSITASGITQRTTQGSDPLKSAMFRWWSSSQRWVREGAALAVGTAATTEYLIATDADAADVDVGNLLRLLDASNGSTNGGGRIKEDILFRVTSKDSFGGFTNIHFTPDATFGTVPNDNMHTLREALPGDAPIAYWSCEDGSNASSIASGLLNGVPMEFVVATPAFSQIDEFAGSAPILKLNNAEIFADIPDYLNTNQAFTIHFLLRMPDSDEAATGSDLVQFYTNGTAENWEIQYATGGGNGDLVIRANDTPTGTNLFSTAYDLHARGTPIMVVLQLQQTAPTTVTYSLATVYFDNTGGFTISGPATATAASVSSLGKLKNIRINPGGGYVEAGFGHLGVIPAAMDYFNFVDPVKGHASEEVIRRFMRLSYEEDVPLVFCGGAVTAQQMGAQGFDTILNIWQTAAQYDLGRFYEARGAYCFEYRTRSTLYAQTPFMTVVYSAGGVLSDLIPTDDDAIRNDITAKRVDGGMYHVEQTTGRLSTAKPQNGGVGRYTDSKEINPKTDAQLPQYAEWLLHLGTVDEARYPSIKLTPAPVSGSITLAQMFSCGVGNRFKLTNTSGRGVYEPIDQLVLGYTLTLHPFVPTLEINGEPASPYNVATLDDAGTRLDTSTHTAAEDIDTTETAIDITSSDGVLWVTTALNPAEFPFDWMINNRERVTVTAIVGASNPQTATVTRSVNGVVASHLTGAVITAADPVNLPY